MSGLLDVPGIGYFHTELAEAALLLSWDRATDRYTLQRPDESPVAYRFEPRLCVAGTNIDIQRYAHPLLDPLIQDTADQLVAVDPVPATQAHAGNLARAFALLAEVDPTYHAHIASSTRRVMLFHERPRVYSFASIAAHGIAFFSTQPNDDEVFFLEDICHQCAHVVFNAVTVRRGDYLHVDPDLKMAELTGDQRDPRKLYSAFHALYTYYNIMRVLQRCERKILSTRAAHELHGRIAFTASNYRADIQTMDRDLYMPQGRLCYEQFKRAR